LPGDLFNLIAPFYMFQIDHAASSRNLEPLLDSWSVFLGVLNVEAAQGRTCGVLREILYGPPNPAELYDRMPGMIWNQVLNPLCWLGLLADCKTDEHQHLVDRQNVTTGLWAREFWFSFGDGPGSLTRQ